MCMIQLESPWFEVYLEKERAGFDGERFLAWSFILFLLKPGGFPGSARMAGSMADGKK